ncbi:MAG: hypothetical protein QM528_09100 [Phycisphaerales bacterium]|nr:hypothetical protein [Phycisphaerales bacterium]
MTENNYFSYVLPEGLTDYFDTKDIQLLCDVKSKTEYYEIVLEEKNIILFDKDTSKYESKGFTETRIQDFPLRGKPIYLLLRRRRWRDKSNPKIIKRNNFTFIAEGANFTEELAVFLKEAN